jgi:hypothetical protein
MIFVDTPPDDAKRIGRMPPTLQELAQATMHLKVQIAEAIGQSLLEYPKEGIKRPDAECAAATEIKSALRSSIVPS